MPIRHEIRTSKVRPKTNLPANSKILLEPKWSKHPYGSNEDEVYEPDWEIENTDLETYINISLRD